MRPPPSPPPSPHAAPRSRAAARGMTLLELLLVMGLIGLVLGAGVGVFSSLDFGRRQALGLVQNVVRAARNAAQARAGPARVRLDLAGGGITAEALEVIGTWHFEGEDLRGAFGLDGRLSGADIVDDGYIGRALSVAASRSSYAEFAVQHDPSFDLREGFALSCALRLSGPEAGTVLQLGAAAGLTVSTDGVLRAWFTPEVSGSTGAPRSGGRIHVESQPGALPLGRWVRVDFEYDRRLSRLSIDGVEVARTSEVQPVWRLEGPLTVGDPRGAFVGAVDALSVSAVAAGETARLPDSVRFDPQAPAEIRFDARGHLDREVHREPVELGLAFDDGQTATVRVGLYGTVE